MNSKTKYIIISGLITGIIGYFVIVPLFISFKSRHKIDWENNDILWIFEDSVKQHIDTVVKLAEIRKSDELYWHHIYQIPNTGIVPLSKYHVLIWKFNELDSILLRDCNFRENINLKIDNYKGGAIYSPDSKPSVFIKYKLKFNEQFNIGINESSVVDQWISFDNYMGFIGKVNKLSLSNENNELMALFDNKDSEVNSMVLLYEKYSKLYLIYLFSEYEINDSVLNIFNF